MNIKIYKTASASIVLALFFTGCASQSMPKRYSTCSGKSFNQLLESTELKPLFNEIARELCTEPCVTEGGTTTEDRPICPAASNNGYSVLITDFVDIQSFTPAS